MFEPRVLPGAHRGVGVQVEALDVGMAWPTGGDRRRRGVTAQAQHPLAGPRPCRDPSDRRRALELRQCRGVERQRVAARVVEAALEVDVGCRMCGSYDGAFTRPPRTART